jgi:hypothetical protein
MNEQPDAARRLRWLQSKDWREVEAWVIADKGYKIALMKQAAAEAMLDLLGENGIVGVVVDLQ